MSADSAQEATDAFFAHVLQQHQERFSKGLGERQHALGFGAFAVAIGLVGWWTREPLFTWMGAIAAALMVAGLAGIRVAHARARRRARAQLDELRRRLKGNAYAADLRVDDDGIDVSNGGNFRRFGWDQFRSVILTPTMCLLWLVRGDFIPIPLRDADEAVLDFIRRRIAVYGRP